MFESKKNCWSDTKISYSEKLGANISSWSYDMEGHAKKCVERHRELANKTTQQLFSLSACSLTCCVFARAEEDLSPPLQTPCGSRAWMLWSCPELGWPPCRRHGRGSRRATCGALLYVAGNASSLESLPRRSVRKRRSAPLFRLCSAWLPAIVHSSALDHRVTTSVSGSRSRQSSVRVVITLECDLHSFLRSCPRCGRLCASWSAGPSRHRHALDD